MRIVFGIMSAVHGAGTVAQLAEALAPHEVVVHHDFSQQADFEIRAQNVRFVAQPKHTGWGIWGFSEGIVHLLDDCLRHSTFDYFQLLSPTCLPIRPLAEFEMFVRNDRNDAHGDAMALDSDTDALVHYGWRTFLPAGSLRFHLLRRMYGSYAVSMGHMRRRAGLCVVTPRVGKGLGARFRERSVHWASRMARDGMFGPNPFSPGMAPYVGSTWFGARPNVCEYLVRKGSDPEIVDYFRRIQFPDEALFATLLHNSGFRIGAANHIISTFVGGRPRWIQMHHLPRFLASGKYFARKFDDDPHSPVRRTVVERVRRVRETELG